MEYGEWQKCPVCNGVGSVSGGYFARAGDSEYWASSSTTDTCLICDGKGILMKPIVEKVKK